MPKVRDVEGQNGSDYKGVVGLSLTVMAKFYILNVALNTVTKLHRNTCSHNTQSAYMIDEVQTIFIPRSVSWFR